MKLRVCLVMVLISLLNLGSPRSAQADILLAGFAADAVVRYDSSGTLVGLFASDATMDGPTAMVYNSAGDLLVLNEFSHNVLRFNGATGSFLGTLITPSALGSVGLTDPDDMEIGLDGHLYLTSHFNTGSNIWKFDQSTGSYLGSFAYSPPTHHAHGFAAGPGGDWFQGHVDSGVVERFDGVTGAFEGVFTSGPSIGPIADMVFGPSHLFVTLDGAGGVARLNAATGAFIDYLIPAGPFQSYWGTMVDGGLLYVANTATGTVKRFDATSGAFVDDFIVGGPGAFDLLVMTAIPEPSTALLSSFGLLTAILFRIRKRG